MTTQLGLPLLTASNSNRNARGGKVRPSAAAYATWQQGLAASPLTSHALTALRQAQAALLRFDVLGLTEDLPGFEKALGARWPYPFARSGCRIPSGSEARNPTAKHAVLGNASATLDSETREAIRALNLLDIELYGLAKRVAAAQGECARRAATGGLRTPQPHGNAATRRCFEDVRNRFQNEMSWQMVAAKAAANVGDIGRR